MTGKTSRQINLMLSTDKSISDQPVASSVDTSLSLGLGPCSHAAEDQKELKQLFGIDLLHTKTGNVMNEGSLPSDLTEQENATVSSEAEKLVAKQKQRAESDFVPMQSTRDTKTELFTFSQVAESDFVPMQSTRDTKTELSSSSYAAEDQKEHKPFFGMDWLHTKAGYVTTKGSLQRIPKKKKMQQCQVKRKN
ncbi:uncharacterized protein LOC120296323 [Eucalyptus grandis]|uniref:uncharacterized protein LOC120296323 n=1 Tax=Eucalyptus grandis TaxID=71139 RepID=UPI00192EFC3C|nr:uncharacterized protein LOC120296323 [Eucalyptus grandis]